MKQQITSSDLAAGRSINVICLGEPLYEFNQRSDGLFETGFGGDTSNCAIAAARSGARSAMLTHLGDDAFAKSFIDMWTNEGVNTDAVRMIPGQETGVYFVNHDNEGHHYTYRRKNSAASNLDSPDIDPQPIQNAQILHVSGISQAISDSAAEAVNAAIRIAKENGTWISYDTNLRLNLLELAPSRDRFHNAIQHCDIVLPGYDDATQLTQLTDPNDIVDFYLNLGCRVVALTMGAQGVLVATTTERRTYAAYAVDSIDANGAGDTFDGAFLSEYTKTSDIWRAAEFANAAAALSTTRSGAVRSMPHRADIETFLENNPTTPSNNNEQE